MEGHNLQISKGPAAAHSYYIENNIKCCQLTLDWSYDGLYFKYYDEEWITLSIGPKTEKNEINKIDTEEKKFMFKKLALNFLSELQDYSTLSDLALIELQGILL